MEQFVKQSSFKKHLEVIKIKLLIALKENKEYKINLWTYILSDITTTLSYLLLFSIVSQLIKEIVDWTFFEFWLYFIFLAIATKSMYNFSIRYFSSILINGKINTTKNQPINQYINETSRNFNGAGLITTLIFIFYLIISLFIYWPNYTLINLSFSLLILVLGIVYFCSFINFLESISFFLKKSEKITRFMNSEINYINENFTPKIFERTNFKTFFYLLPTAIYSYFPVEILKGNHLLFFNYLPLILVTFTIFIIGTYLLWHFGLKKYEGYN